MTPTQVGYACAAMLRYRPHMADCKRIEAYPSDQWGWMGLPPDYSDVPLRQWAIRNLRWDEGRETERQPGKEPC